MSNIHWPGTTIPISRNNGFTHGFGTTPIGEPRPEAPRAKSGPKLQLDPRRTAGLVMDRNGRRVVDMSPKVNPMSIDPNPQASADKRFALAKTRI